MFKMVVIRLFVVSLFTLLVGSFGYAQDENDDKHIEVSMRMIGHQLLLNFGDSTSRVLPVEKKENRYGIKFQREFSFVPELLVKTIDSIMKYTHIANHYLVEVENCYSKSIVYSYEVNESTNFDLIPCLSRALTKDCYAIFINIYSSNQNKSAKITPINESKNDNWYGIAAVVIGIVLLLAVMIFWYYRRSKNTLSSSTVITIGDFEFDKRNMMLIHEGNRIELTSKETDLLELLYASANDTLKREVILEVVWGDEGDYVGRTLDVFISKLRKKLEADSSIKIANIRGIGYKLILNSVG